MKKNNHKQTLRSQNLIYFITGIFQYWYKKLPLTISENRLFLKIQTKFRGFPAKVCITDKNYFYRPLCHHFRWFLCQWASPYRSWRLQHDPKELKNWKFGYLQARPLGGRNFLSKNEKLVLVYTGLLQIPFSQKTATQQHWYNV